jgi:hypothetical protein
MALLMPAAARSGVCSNEVRGPRHDLQLFAGYSPDSSTVIGTAPDRQFALAGLSYGYRCWTPGSVSVYYTAALMPAAILKVPAQTIYSFSPPFQRRVEAHAVYGFGVAPIGFAVEFDRWRVHPFVETREESSPPPSPFRRTSRTPVV